MSNIITALNRRYATKAYDTSKKVSQENIDIILEAMRLTPSSFGLQPWKFIVIENPSIREELKNNSRGQSQITDASHLIVIASKKDMKQEDVEKFLQLTSSTTGAPLESLDGYKGMIMGMLSHMGEEAIKARNAKQTYIALGFGLTAAASLEIDSTPMEGFDKAKYDEILGLSDYTSSVVLTLGYRSAEDKYQHAPKVRFSKDVVIEGK